MSVVNIAMQMISYFIHPSVTITIVVGGEFYPVLPRSSNEVLIFRDTWYFDGLEQKATRLQRRRPCDPKRMYYLSNVEEIHQIRLAHGINSHFINIGCFIDETIFTPEPSPPVKDFDAVMNARFTLCHDGTELKRHDLTRKIASLALLDPIFESHDFALKQQYRARPNCKFCNDARLPASQVADVLRRSYAGLILTAREGVCRASSEYLLTGIPVVSTRSVGGRDVWYDTYNSIFVDPTEEAVYEAVNALKAQPRDPLRIRNNYLSRAAVFRDRFKQDVLTPILRDFDVEIPADEVMRTCPFRWWAEP